MTESDSGVDTGSESNESNSMSVGSPPRSDEDKDINDFVEKPHPPYHNLGETWRSLEILQPACSYGFSDYRQHDQVRKMKPSTSQRKSAVRWRQQPIANIEHLLGERRLRAAANANDIETVKNLLDSGVNPCAADNRQRTALHFTATLGHTEIARLLIERGADPSQRDSVGNTPLHLAACTSNIEMVTLLLKADPNVNDFLEKTLSPNSLVKSPLNVNEVCYRALHMLEAILDNKRKPGNLLYSAPISSESSPSVRNTVVFPEIERTDVNALDYSGRSPFQLAQSKLKLLQRNLEYSSAQLKTEIVNVLEMMQVYLQRSGREGEIDLLNAFSNRLQHHQTREEVDTDVKDLLSSLSHLNLQTA